MPRQYAIQTAFNAGEISPRLAGRVDVEKYRHSCRTLRNCILYPHGASSSRPGFRFVSRAAFDAWPSLLVQFVYSNIQAYELEFGDHVIRFFKDQGRIPYQISSPWGHEDLDGLQFAQSADVLYITHEDYPVYKLTRLGHTSWTLDIVTWEDGPYLNQNMDGVTHINVSALTGTGVTVGARYLYRDADMGTYSAALGTPEEFCTPGRPYVVFIFTAVRGKLSSVKIRITTAAGASDTATAYLYASDGAAATGAILATSANSEDLSSAGEVVFTFEDPPEMTEGDQYAIVIGSTAPDAGTRADVLSADDTAYLSGYAATPTGAVTPLTTDWRLNINYCPSGLPELFEAGHVGSLWRVRHSGSSVRKLFNTWGQYSDPIELKGDFYVDCSPDASWNGRIVLQMSTNKNSWFDVASFHYSTKQVFTELDTGVWYRLKCAARSGGNCTATIAQEERWGVFRITAVTNGHSATADILSPVGSTSPTPWWREGAWSAKRGYPKAICFHDQRLCFGGTSHQPYTIWLSWTGDHEQFTPGATDNASFTLPLEVIDNRILWMMSHSSILVGTLGEEVQIAPVKQGALSQTNFDIKLQGTMGSAAGIPPLRIGSSALFVQLARRKLIEMGYSVDTDSLAATDLSLFSEHITASGIKSFAYQQEPDSVIWMVRGDGKLASLTYYRKENVLGWALHETEGAFESVSVIPSSMGTTSGRDELWAVVRRTVGGITRRFIEILTDHEAAVAATDYVCLDASLSYSGAAKTTFTGLDHLEGETVSVVADGWYVGEHRVLGGSITLETAAWVVHAGRRYTCITQPMSLEAGAGDGTAQGRAKKVDRVIARFLDTLGGSYGDSLDKLMPIKLFTPDQTVLGEAPELKSGDADLSWPGNWTTDAAPMIVQDQPYPMTLLALVIVATTND